MATLEDVTAALEQTRVTPSGVSFANKSLKLDTEEDARVVVEAIEGISELEYLNLEGNTLGVDAAKTIARALEKHPKFKRALWKDMFTGRMKTEIPKALQYLGDGLVKAGVRLTELDLSDNAFGPIGVEGLASLLRSSSSFALEELRLNNNGLGITGGKLLAGALLDCYNSSKANGKPLALKVFVAGRNRLENEGATALSEVFKAIGTLEEIAMPQNGIYHKGISALSDAFTFNKNLQILNLNDNTIGAQGAQAIAKALPHLQKLKSLNFGDCLLKTKGALFLASGLKQDHADIEEVILGFNEVGVEGGLALVDALVNKSKLKNVILDGNMLNEAAKTKIKEKFKEIGKLNALGSLDECESDDDNDEHEESHHSEENSSDEEGEEDNNTTTTENKLVLNNSSQIVCLEDFINNPTAENFLSLGNNRENVILTESQKMSNHLEGLIPILMKVSALSDQEQVAKPAMTCTESLYKELFAWAEKNDKLSLINNTLLIHLGLIKCEDKKFKPSWNVGGCLSALEKILQKNYVPDTSKDTLSFFINRKNNVIS